MRNDVDLSFHLHRKEECCTKFLILKKLDQPNKSSGPGNTTVYPSHLKCKSYFCPKCVKQKQARYMTKLKNGMKNETWRFLTLTTNKNVHDRDEAIKNINLAWNALGTILRSKFKGLKYFKVLEISENNSVHLHLIINKYIPAIMIQHYWNKYWHSYIIKIKKVTTIQETYSYMTKYVFKSTDNFRSNKIFYLNNKRRFSFSFSWDSEPEKEKLYTVLSKNIYSLSSLIQYLRYSISEGDILLTDIFYNTLPDDLKQSLSDTIEGMVA